MVARFVEVPPSWWTVPIDVGTLAVPGDEVLLVLADPPINVSGIVVSAQSGDAFSLAFRPAAVAVPSEAAALVAAAEREGVLITAIRTPQHQQ